VSGPIKVTFGEIANGQQAVTQVSSQVQQQLDDLKSSIARLVGTWEGQAAAAYQVKQAQWDRSAEELAQVLSQIGVALGTANDNYQSAEQANVSRW